MDHAIEFQRMQDSQQRANEEACEQCARENGHTAEEADNCDDFSVGCPNCPFKK